ncbi:MAG: NADH-quinone oxidoreductase subunit NuoG [Acidimicrobiales bacterium]
MTDVADEKAQKTTVTITVDGNEFEAEPGRMLIDACEDAGVYIPRFCYHPRMRPVGMCRMCIVDVDTGRGAALQPSCMLKVADGMVVDTESDRTKKAQDGVLEFLLVNHPLDCPVCDKGGECPLQDQTMSHGPGESRFVEEKRHFEKPIPISGLVDLDRERCILCDRCTRFAKEVVGDPLIHFIDRGNQTQVNTFPDEPFSSYFSGNTVQICPVGALTASSYRFKARPWDLDEVPGTFPNPMGDRVTIQASRNRVLRYLGVDSDAVNWSWLTDRDRFSFTAIHSEQRLTEPLVRSAEGDLVAASWSTALTTATDAIRAALDTGGPTSVGVIGGARLSTEDQYAWARLAKGVIGTDNVDAQLADGLPVDLVLGAPRATIADACEPGGTTLLLSADPKEELGTLFIRLRHAATEDRATLVELTPTATGLSDVAAHSLRVRPGDLAEVARRLVGAGGTGDLGPTGDDAIASARAALGDGPVTLVVGRASLAESPAVIADAVRVLLDGLDGSRVLPVMRRGNVFGALDTGLVPGHLPGRTTLAAAGDWYREAWGQVPAEVGLDTTGMLRAAAAGDLDVLVLLGADPLVDHPDRELVRSALAGVGTVIALDLFATTTVDRHADIVFPTAGFAEIDGTHTNLEGRLSPLGRKVTPPGTARSDWMIAAELAHRLGGDLGLDSVDAVWDEIEALSPLHAGATRSIVAESADGVVVPIADANRDGRPPMVTGLAPVDPVAAVRADAYALRLVVDRPLYDAGTTVSHAPALAALTVPARARLNPADRERLGVSGDAEVTVSTGRGSIRIATVADHRVPPGSIAIAFNCPGADAGELIDVDAPFAEARVQTR